MCVCVWWVVCGRGRGWWGVSRRGRAGTQGLTCANETLISCVINVYGISGSVCRVGWLGGWVAGIDCRCSGFFPSFFVIWFFFFLCSVTINDLIVLHSCLAEFLSRMGCWDRWDGARGIGDMVRYASLGFWGHWDDARVIGHGQKRSSGMMGSLGWRACDGGHGQVRVSEMLGPLGWRAG